MKLYRNTFHILVGIRDDVPDDLIDATLADNVSGVLTDNGVYVDASQPGGPLGIVDWGYTTVPPYPPVSRNPSLYGWSEVSPDGVLDSDGFVIEGAFLDED